MDAIHTVWEASALELDPLAQANLAIKANCQSIALIDNPALSAEVLARIQDLGLAVHCLTATAAATGKSLTALIDHAIQLRIPNVLLAVSAPWQTYSQAYNELYDLLYAHAPRADQSSVRLLIQAPQQALLLSPLELRSLIDRISSPNVGCCLDLAGCLAHNLSVGDWLETLSVRVFACRISSDCPIPAELSAHWSGINAKAFFLTNNPDVITESGQPA